MADALLRPDQRERLFLRVELHFEAALVPIGYRLAQFGQAFRFWVAVVHRLIRGFVQRRQDVRRRRQVRVADAESDHVVALRALGGDLLGDFGEQVRGEGLDALGELHVGPQSF